MNKLTCPLATFQALLRRLAADRHRMAFLRVGHRHAPPGREWLVRDLVSASVSVPGPLFGVALSIGPPEVTVPSPHLERQQSRQELVGLLYLGVGRRQGHLWGFVRAGQSVEPLHCLSLVGPGMYQLPVAGGGFGASDNERSGFVAGTFSSVGYSAGLERWSRTIGALGGGDIWRRLVGLRVAVVGCGRTGSLVAANLARLGVHRLTLIDPDAVEQHNLGEMDAVTEADLGDSKAEAIANYLRILLSHSPDGVAALSLPITDPAAMAAARVCDVLFCCADNDAARVATALIATLYHKVLVDFGTGVHLTSPEASAVDRAVGADVRLIVPGDGCLLCWGHVHDYSQAVEDLCNHRPPESLSYRERRWRAGSLRSLNQLAAALGTQMLQDLVAGRAQGSSWAHVEFDGAGRMTVVYPLRGSSTECALCARAGLGDGGMRWT